MNAFCAPVPFWIVHSDRRVVLSTPLSYYAFYDDCGTCCLELFHDPATGYGCLADRARYLVARNDEAFYQLGTSAAGTSVADASIAGENAAATEERHLVWLPDDVLWESWEALVPEHCSYTALSLTACHTGHYDGWHLLRDRLYHPYHVMD